VGGTFIPILLVAVCLGVLLSLALFRVGPAWAKNIFFQADGTWRRFGQVGWLLSLAVAVVAALLATPHNGA
jgi:hypothetical protein